MKNLSGKLLASAACVAAMLILSIPMLAHHGTAAFDTVNMVTVKGTVTNFDYSNPHAQIYFEAKNDKGVKETWQGELTAPNKLGRAGWSKNTLKPGDSVTVSGYAAKDGSHIIWIRKLIGPDGNSLQLFED